MTKCASDPATVDSIPERTDLYSGETVSNRYILEYGNCLYGDGAGVHTSDIRHFLMYLYGGEWLRLQGLLLCNQLLEFYLLINLLG